MLVKKEEEEIPKPFPSSKRALALGNEERDKWVLPPKGYAAFNTKLNLGIQPALLPVFEPITKPEIPAPTPKAKVVPIKPKVLKQGKKKQVKKEEQVATNRQTDKREPDDTLALQSWLREYASIGIDPNVEHISGRNKAQTVDGRTVKVNRVLACFLQDGDKWGGTQMWDRTYGPPIDGIINAVDYPTRERYKQRERGSQAVRVALAHETVPVGEEWQSSTYSLKMGNIQGFEGFARPPTLEELWRNHRLALSSGRLTGPTIHETSEMKGFTFYVDHGEGIAEPTCKVIDPQGNRFSYPFNFYNGRVAYADAKSMPYRAVLSAVNRLFSAQVVDVHFVDTKKLPVAELTQYGTPLPASNEDVVKETIKTLAEIMPRPEVSTAPLLQDESFELMCWLRRASRLTEYSRLKSGVFRKVPSQGLLKICSLTGVDVAYRRREMRQANFTDTLRKLGVIGPRGMSQSQRNSYMRWWLYNAESQESADRHVFEPISKDQFEQMRVHWTYQYACKRITDDLFVRILNRLNAIQRKRRKDLEDLLLGAEEPLPALPFPGSLVVEEAKFLKGVRDKIDEEGPLVEGEFIESSIARLQAPKGYEFSPSGLLIKSVVEPTQPIGEVRSKKYVQKASGLWVPEHIDVERIEPRIGNLKVIEHVPPPIPIAQEVPSAVVEEEIPMIDVCGVMVPNFKRFEKVAEESKPSKWDRAGYVLQRVGEFMAAVAPK